MSLAAPAARERRTAGAAGRQTPLVCGPLLAGRRVGALLDGRVGDGSQDLNNPDVIKDVKDPEPGKGLALDLGVIPDSALQKCAASTTEGDK